MAIAKNIIRKTGTKSEIDFISSGEDIISFPVYKPRIITQVKINTIKYISQEKNWDLCVLKTPGPHNEKIRGN
jgi:hypothetical protein